MSTPLHGPYEVLLEAKTRADGDTGLRYQRHRERGTSVMPFARLRTDERAFWFLGPARYVKHESELPMAITWKLDHPLPGDLFVSFRGGRHVRRVEDETR